jgi:hypothetical protein
MSNVRLSNSYNLICDSISLIEDGQIVDINTKLSDLTSTIQGLDLTEEQLQSISELSSALNDNATAFTALENQIDLKRDISDSYSKTETDNLTTLTNFYNKTETDNLTTLTNFYNKTEIENITSLSDFYNKTEIDEITALTNFYTLTETNDLLDTKITNGQDIMNITTDGVHLVNTSLQTAVSFLDNKDVNFFGNISVNSNIYVSGNNILNVIDTTYNKTEVDNLLDGKNFNINNRSGTGTSLLFSNTQLSRLIGSNGIETSLIFNPGEDDDGQILINLNQDNITTLTNVYNKTEVDSLFSNLIDGAPVALNTLNELAAALADDANYATNIENQLLLKADKSDTYTETEVDNLLNTKQPVFALGNPTTTHTKLFDSNVLKSVMGNNIGIEDNTTYITLDASHIYTKTETDNLLGNKQDTLDLTDLTVGDLLITGASTFNDVVRITGQDAESLPVSHPDGGVYIGRGNGNTYGMEIVANSGTSFPFIDFTLPDEDTRAKMYYSGGVFYTKVSSQTMLKTTHDYHSIIKKAVIGTDVEKTETLYVSGNARITNNAVVNGTLTASGVSVIETLEGKQDTLTNSTPTGHQILSGIQLASLDASSPLTLTPVEFNETERIFNFGIDLSSYYNKTETDNLLDNKEEVHSWITSSSYNYLDAGAGGLILSSSGSSSLQVLGNTSTGAEGNIVVYKDLETLGEIDVLYGANLTVSGMNVFNTINDKVDTSDLADLTVGDLTITGTARITDTITGASNLTFSDATASSISSKKLLNLYQTGDQYGSSFFKIMNRGDLENACGAVLGTYDNSFDICELTFDNNVYQRHFRLESRAGYVKAGNPSWHLGGGEVINNPCLAVGDTRAGITKLGVGTFSDMTEILYVSGNTKIDGSLTVSGVSVLDSFDSKQNELYAVSPLQKTINVGEGGRLDLEINNTTMLSMLSGVINPIFCAGAVDSDGTKLYSRGRIDFTSSRLSQGLYKITFASSYGSANYVVTCSGYAFTSNIDEGTLSATSFSYFNRSYQNTVLDRDNFFMVM